MPESLAKRAFLDIINANNNFTDKYNKKILKVQTVQKGTVQKGTVQKGTVLFCIFLTLSTILKQFQKYKTEPSPFVPFVLLHEGLYVIGMVGDDVGAEDAAAGGGDEDVILKADATEVAVLLNLVIVEEISVHVL